MINNALCIIMCAHFGKMLHFQKRNTCIISHCSQISTWPIKNCSSTASFWPCTVAPHPLSWHHPSLWPNPTSWSPPPTSGRTCSRFPHMSPRQSWGCDQWLQPTSWTWSSARFGDLRQRRSHDSGIDSPLACNRLLQPHFATLHLCFLQHLGYKRWCSAGWPWALGHIFGSVGRVRTPQGKAWLLSHQSRSARHSKTATLEQSDSSHTQHSQPKQSGWCIRPENVSSCQMFWSNYLPKQGNIDVTSSVKLTSYWFDACRAFKHSAYSTQDHDPALVRTMQHWKKA